MSMIVLLLFVCLAMAKYRGETLPKEIIIPPRYPFEPMEPNELPIPCGGPAPEHRRCGDGFFLVTQVKETKSKFAADSCPSGYQLARLNNHELLLDAVEVVFLCLGPFGKVWIEDVLEGEEKRTSHPVKLIAPDAIEKGCLNIVPARIDRSKTANEKLFSLCQRILASP